MLHQNGQTRLGDFRASNHKIHAGYFSPNGGKIEEGESSYDAAVREESQETDTTVRNLIYRGRIRFINERRTVGGKPMKFNMEVDYWDCHDFTEHNSRPTEVPLVWIDDAQLLHLKELHEGDRQVWQWLQENSKPFLGEIVQNGETLVRVESRIIGYNISPLSG